MKKWYLIMALLLTGCPIANQNKAHQANAPLSDSRRVYYQSHQYHYIDDYDDAALDGASEFYIQLPSISGNPYEIERNVFNDITNQLKSLGYTPKVACLFPFIIVPIPEKKPADIRKHFLAIDGIQHISRVVLHGGEGELESLPILAPGNKVEGNWLLSSAIEPPALRMNINRASNGWEVTCGPNATGSFDGITLRVSQTPTSSAIASVRRLEYEGRYKAKNSYVIGEYRKLSDSLEVSTGSFVAIWMWGTPATSSL